jgi:hypothetical protein
MASAAPGGAAGGAAGAAGGAGGGGARGLPGGSLTEFIRLHSSQLKAMDLPEHLWPVLHHKISREQFDAADSFRVEYVEADLDDADGGFRLVVEPASGLPAEGDVWLVEHMWTTTEALARPMLKEHPSPCTHTDRTAVPKLF